MAPSKDERSRFIDLLDRRCPPADPVRFETLYETLGDRDAVAVSDAVQSYLQEAPMHMESLRQAARQKAADRLGHAAHALKGSSALFGAFRLAHFCRHVETLARRKALKRAEAWAAVIADEFDRVCTVLTAGQSVIDRSTKGKL